MRDAGRPRGSWQFAHGSDTYVFRIDNRFENASGSLGSCSSLIHTTPQQQQQQQQQGFNLGSFPLGFRCGRRCNLLDAGASRSPPAPTRWHRDIHLPAVHAALGVSCQHSPARGWVLRMLSDGSAAHAESNTANMGFLMAAGTLSSVQGTAPGQQLSLRTVSSRDALPANSHASNPDGAYILAGA